MLQICILNCFLVLHGGSGISSSQIKKAVKLGIVKININTELRMAFKGGLQKGLKGKEIKPYKILPLAGREVQKLKFLTVLIKSK